MANLFDEYKSLFSGSNVELSSPYMINRLLSFSAEGFPIAKECNKFIGRIPNKLLLLIYKESINSKKAPFVKYAKVPKLKEPKLIKNVCKTFCCNNYHAEQIIQIYRLMKIKPEKLFGLKIGE